MTTEMEMLTAYFAITPMEGETEEQLKLRIRNILMFYPSQSIFTCQNLVHFLRERVGRAMWRIDARHATVTVWLYGGSAHPAFVELKRLKPIGILLLAEKLPWWRCWFRRVQERKAPVVPGREAPVIPEREDFGGKPQKQGNSSRTGTA